MADTLHRLVQSLQDEALYPHPVEYFRVIETHISIILLTGDYAYKFKKPVDFGFLDFSSLARRRYYCEQELRLNRRLAPELYLEVIAVTAGPALGGTGEVLEYAVKMREFPQQAQFDHMLADGTLQPAHLDALAVRVAGFHDSVAQARADSDYASVDQVWAPVEENFRQILEQVQDAGERSRLQQLQAWSHKEYERCLPQFVQRKQQGFIRECHGDLHLRNVALVDMQPVAFDCIEFNEALRWIDIMSEVAFMVMDLDDRGQPALASRFLNHWLQYSGDYEGLAVLRYYLVYRAMVRAKVDSLRIHQADVSDSERGSIMQDYRGYLDLAEGYTRPPAPQLLLMHGLSGSGKTTVSQQLLQQLPAIRLRSDVERKRLFGLPPEARTDSAVDQGIYSQQASDKTYALLASTARQLLQWGYTVIVDAAFLEQSRRHLFRQLARELALPFSIIDCPATVSELRHRLQTRAQDKQEVSEADLQVLEHQLQHQEELDKQEQAAVISVNTTDPAATRQAVQRLRREQ
jgi:aminoglycoside phosphotransferase family enzyme/predicted kinase